MTRKFTGLRIIATLLQVYGAAMAAIGVLGFLLCCFTGAITNSMLANSSFPSSGGTIWMSAGIGIAFFALCLFPALGAFGAGEFFHLMIAIEENTRSLYRINFKS